QYTGQTIEEIERNVERDKFFSASEAKTFGLVDEVFEKRPAPADDDAAKAAAAAASQG
ncbi:MAG TPA: ATP-dependent Clp protease proteolytic subunit, partial [Allosphingosinicella sp.]|nr:ATP-dependent Clp protease proteolytic subunit [Allosphingosinicella sp.]